MGLNHTAGTDPDNSADKRVEIGWGESESERVSANRDSTRES